MNTILLSKQEIKMLNALSYGLLYKEIADVNHLSVNTVKKHLKSSYKKLHVNKRKEAVQKYFELARAQNQNTSTTLPSSFSS